jgi:hypothetical protein
MQGKGKQMYMRHNDLLLCILQCYPNIQSNATLAHIWVYVDWGSFAHLSQYHTSLKPVTLVLNTLTSVLWYKASYVWSS